MNETLNSIPIDLQNFVITLLLSLLLGLSQRKHFQNKEGNWLLGTDRTHAIIGIMGYVFYIVQPDTLAIYLMGGVGLLILTGIYYIYKIQTKHGFGITSILITLLCYGIGPLVCIKQLWVSIMVTVSVLILNEMKESFIAFTKKMNNQEFINLAKFLMIAGVILPILPHEEIIDGLPLTPFNIWSTTVVISGFSYISYLLKKYVFNKSGILVSGILGGIYSSTATCVILSKKAKEAKENERGEYVTAIFGAISMMYLKYVVLLSFFNLEMIEKYCYLFFIMFGVSISVTIFYYHKAQKQQRQNQEEENLLPANEDNNPLELKIALVFALLFVIFTIITNYTIQQFGASGLRTLSLLVGVTDITPFILNLFQAKYAVAESLLILAAFQAMISNNIVKMLYAMLLSDFKIKKELLIGFGTICVINVALLFFTL